jgi:serine/threonine-protein kinase
MLSLRLLGPTAFAGAEQSDFAGVFAAPKRLALLSFLAVARPHGFHRRESLLELLWADCDRRLARSTLRSTLHALRLALGPHAIVNLGDEEVRLDCDLIQCDLRLFESEAARGNRRAALDVYRGDLLHGFTLRNAPAFERWLDDERFLLRERAKTLASELADQYLAANDVPSALWAARRGLVLDPSDEALARKAMQLFESHGERVRALRVYEELAAVLKRDLDVEPSSETRALRATLIGGTGSVDRTKGRELDTCRIKAIAVHSGKAFDLEARRLYAEGRFFWNKRSQQGLERAVECFVAASNYDPCFAAAYAGLSDTYQSLATYGYRAFDEALSQAKAAADAAIALDDTLADAHTSCAGVLALRGESARADESYRRAIRLNPHHAPALHWYATFLRQQGRSPEATHYSQRAVEIEPLSTVMTFTAGTILRDQRQYGQALALCRRAVELDPSFAPGHYFLACLYALTGRSDEAISSASRSLSLAGEHSLYLSGLTYVLARFERASALRALDALERCGTSPAEMSDRALAYVGLGEQPSAIACLERAHLSGRLVPRQPLSDPVFDPIRGCPGFVKLIEKIGKSRRTGAGRP